MSMLEQTDSPSMSVLMYANDPKGNRQIRTVTMDSNPAYIAGDVAAIDLETLAKMDRGDLSLMDGVPIDSSGFCARRMARFKTAMLARLDAAPWASLSVYPAGEVQQMLGVDPRLIPGVTVSHGAASLPVIDPFTRMYSGSAGHPSMSDYVDASTVRAWVTSDDWNTTTTKLRPDHVNGYPIRAWNPSVGLPDDSSAA